MDYSYPLLCSCERNREREALITPEGESLTFSELEDRIARLTTGLTGLGVRGKSVCSVLPNGVDALVLYMALARAGAVSVPVNTRLTTPEKAHIAEDARASFIVTDEEGLDSAFEIAAGRGGSSGVMSTEPAPGTIANLEDLGASSPAPPPTDSEGDDQALATIMYTSGTTGRPKGVLRTHRANSWNIVNSALGSPRTHRDVELFTLPIFGIGFLHFLSAALVGGATVVLEREFDAADTWEKLDRHGVTRTFLAPTMIDSMLAVPDNRRWSIESLEQIYTAYTFPARLRDRALERFGDRFTGMYGLTEAQLTCDDSKKFESEPTAVGRSMGVSRVAVFAAGERIEESGATGEIAFEGPSVMAGYNGQEEATENARCGDWILTGDLGCFDQAGELHYVGRSKEMIKTGGFSVDPTEVENAILTLDEVREAAVVGVEDEHWGEAVVAFVTPTNGSPVEESRVVEVLQTRDRGVQSPEEGTRSGGAAQEPDREGRAGPPARHLRGEVRVRDPRVAQVQRWLEEDDLDAVALFLPENILLVTGFFVRIPGYCMVLVPRQGEAILMIGEFDLDRANAVWDGEVEFLEASSGSKDSSYGLLGLLGVGASVRSRLSRFAEETTGPGARIGFEGSFEQVSPALLVDPNTVGEPTRELLREAFETENLVDFTGRLEQVRSVKTEREIEKIGRANEIARLAHEAVLDAPLTEMTEVQVRALVEGAVCELGHSVPGVESVRAIASVGSGSDLTVEGCRYPIARTRRIEPGDLVMIEMGTIADGYWADTTLTAVAGTAGSEIQQRANQVLNEAMEAGLAAAVPGARGADVDRVIREICLASGISGVYPHHSGHGVGFCWHENTANLTPASGAVLESGMCIAIEPGFYSEEVDGALRQEHAAVITSEGAVPLVTTERRFGQG